MSVRDAGQGSRSGVEIERIVPDTPEWRMLHAEHLQRYEFVASRMPAGARILDAGCGVGYGSLHLLERGASAVVGVDIAEEALAVARSRFSRPAITFVRDDCQELREVVRYAPFRMICNLENLEHLPDPRRFLARACALLAPDGVLVTSTPNRIGTNRIRGMHPDAPSVNPYHHHEFTLSEFQGLLAGYFQSVEMYVQTLDPIERMHFEPALASIWHNPAMRIGRWIHVHLLHRPVPMRLDEILPARRFAIRDGIVDDELAITQIAVCRGPRAVG